ncbi:MAG: PQQ-binding-like beta-propeller repeat protein [Planctomycetes bacterium]|nr:PQQ-binding-like beta-propeller repeat protein [Planctomycetota bacterium]MCB9886522.1 PQQ-binding-like beta-propeller repeat protein [Planctomycetota bacterium]
MSYVNALTGSAALVALIVSGSGVAALAQDQPRRVEPRVLWKHAPEGAEFEGVIAHRGVVYALDRAGKVQALEAPTGEVLWTSPVAFQLRCGYGLVLSPAADFDALLVSGETGLTAIDRGSGELLWHTEIPQGVASPAVAGDVVVAGGFDGKIHGFKLRTGELLYSVDYLADRPEDPPGFSGESARLGDRPARPGDAAADGDLVVVPVFDQCRVIAVDAAKGERRWAYATAGWVYPCPTIGERLVLVASQDKHLHAVDRQTGALVWKVKARARNEGAAVIADGRAFFGSCDSRLYCVGIDSGEVAWKYETEHEKGFGAPIYSRPLVLGDKVYLAAMSGKLYVVDRRSGELVAKMTPVPDSEPNSDLAEMGGLLFLTTRKDGEKGESAVVGIAVR